MSIQADGLDGVVELFDRLQNRVNNLQPYFQGIGQILQNSMEENFENETSPSGRAWTPLKAKTIQAKGHSKKLWNTGRMQGSVYTRATNKSVTVGFNSAYGAFHQKGTKNMPARPFLPLAHDGKLDSGVKMEIMEFLEDELTNLN